MDADRQVVFAGESADARQCGMVGARAFASGKVCEVVVPGHNFANGLPNAGEFLDSFDKQVDGAEVGCVKSAKGGVNSAELDEFAGIFGVFELIIGDGGADGDIAVASGLDAGRTVQIVAGPHKRLVLRPFFQKGHAGNKGVLDFGVVHAFEQ